jgi:hypothetical protein
MKGIMHPSSPLSQRMSVKVSLLLANRMLSGKPSTLTPALIIQVAKNVFTNSGIAITP